MYILELHNYTGVLQTNLLYYYNFIRKNKNIFRYQYLVDYTGFHQPHQIYPIRQLISHEYSLLILSSICYIIMSQYQDPEKNRIRCQAKIRTMTPHPDQQKFYNEGFNTRVIKLENQDPLNLLDLALQLELHPNQKADCCQGLEQVESTFASSKMIYDQLESTKQFNKNSLEDSWSKTQNQQIASLLSKQELIKRSQFVDFLEFQKNINPSIINPCDNSFEESRILPSYHFQNSTKNLQEFSRQNTYLERALEEKNVQIINILVSKNQEKKSLEKKIFDLQFQMFNQKRNSDRALNTIALSLKNAEGICQTQQIQIKRLQKQLQLSIDQRQKTVISHEMKVQQLLRSIFQLQNSCCALRKQVQNNTNSLDMLRFQKNELLKVVEQVQRQKQNYEKVELMKQNLSTEFQMQLGIQNIESLEEEQIHSSYESHNADNCLQSEQSVESHVSYLQTLIKQYERQLAEDKKKMKEQKKLIVSLEHKVQQLEGISYSLQIVNKILADSNDEIMGMSLRQLNQSFQYDKL